MPESEQSLHGDTIQLQYVAIDQSFDAQQAARDAANDRLTQELNEGGRMSRLVKSIWKGGAFKEYYELKYTRDAQAQIESSGNTLHYQTDEEQSARARMATIDRFLHQNDEMIHTEAGESREEVAAEVDLAREMKDLIRRNIEGQLSEAAMLEERTRLINVYQETHGTDSAQKGKVRIDNMVEITAAVRGAIDHGESLESVLENMKITLGESRSGVRTEARYNRVERIADKVAKTKIGSLVGPETVVTVATLAASLLRYGSHSVIGAATKSFIPGIAGGLWAGLRENKRMKDDRTQHAREMAQGKEVVEGSKRREEIEEARYHSASAQELTGILNGHFGEDSPFDSKESIETALAALGAIETRVKLSDSRHMDLITYSDAGMIEEERLALDIARAEAKVAARQRLEDTATRQLLGIDEGVTLEALIDERSDMFAVAVENDISDKDRAFEKLKRRRVAEAAVKGAVFGTILGLVSQEGIASLSDSREGLLEQSWNADDTTHNGTMHQTLLESIIGGTGETTTDVGTSTHYGPDLSYVAHPLGEHGNVSVSGDVTFETNSDGTILLKDYNGSILADQLTTDTTGGLSAESLAHLSGAGLVVEDLSHSVDLPPVSTSEMVSLDQYITVHHENTIQVTRDLWYDNDTPRFDKNELELQWGGASGTGLSEATGYQFSVSGMMSDGSYAEGKTLVWQEAAQAGNLKLAVSASADTQTDVFMVDVKPDGTIDIPSDSPAAQFFSSQNGQAVFEGKYAEVVEVVGLDENGTTHINPLATLVGTDNASTGSYTVTNEVPQTEYRPEYKITSSGYDVVSAETTKQDTFTEMAPFIPIIPRRSLEVIGYRRNERERNGRELVPGYYAGRGEISFDEALRLRRERSPRLNDNPEAALRLGGELDFYHDLLLDRRGREYLDSLDRDIAASPELSKLSPDIKSIVTIPVAAASEADNIYKTLSLYAQQDPEKLRRNVVYLHVNWVDDMMSEPAKVAVIERTRSEIERARADFPDLKIATTETEYVRAEVKNGIIGHISRRMADTTLMCLRSGVKRGDIQQDQDVLVLRNDADMNGMGRNYLGAMQDNMEQNEEIDVFTGTTRFGVERYTDLPGFGVVTNIMQMGNVLGASSRYNKIHLGGANAGVRASTLAAVGALGFGSWTGAGSDDVELGWRIAAARSGEIKQNLDNPPASYGYGYSMKVSPNRKVLKRVTGGTIDTNGDRLEALYRAGGEVVDAWDDYDGNGGYRERGEALGGSRVEDVERDFDSVAERIRRNIERIMGSNGNDALSRSVLAFSFPDKTHYRFTRNDEDKVEFTFTPRGKVWLQSQMLRDGAGRHDPYGDKLMRRLYGVVSPRNGKLLVPSRAPLVRPL